MEHAVDVAEAERAVRTAAAELARVVPVGRDRFAFFPGGEHEFWRRFVGSALGHVGLAARDDLVVDRVLERLRERFASAAAWQVYPDVRPALAALRAAGVRLAIVSNWDSRLPHLVRVLGLDELFDALAVSHLEGVEKPAPELFRRALARLGARPDQALHAGNLLDIDVEGAHAAGIDAVLVDRGGRAGDGPGVIRDLGGLVELVAA